MSVSTAIKPMTGWKSFSNPNNTILVHTKPSNTRYEALYHKPNHLLSLR